MRRYHANGIGALLLESFHKRDNARPEPVGGINQVVGVEPGVSHLLDDCFQLLVIRTVCFPIFGGFQQGSEAMVQPCVIRDGLHPPSIFSRSTFAEESVCTFLVLDIPAQLCDMRIRLDDFLVCQLELMVIVVSGSMEIVAIGGQCVEVALIDHNRASSLTLVAPGLCEFLIAPRAFSGPAAKLIPCQAPEATASAFLVIVHVRPLHLGIWICPLKR